MNLEQTKKLQDIDHWKLLEELEGCLTELSQAVGTIRNEFEGIAEARKSLAKEWGKLSYLKSVIAMKLSIMPEEQKIVIEEAGIQMLDRFVKEEPETYEDMEF